MYIYMYIYTYTYIYNSFFHTSPTSPVQTKFGVKRGRIRRGHGKGQLHLAVALTAPPPTYLEHRGKRPSGGPRP